jgi:hypothetical protein
MNLILLQSGYTIANISGEMKSRIEYYKSLEKVKNDKDIFRLFISAEVKKSLEDYLKIVGAGRQK